MSSLRSEFSKLKKFGSLQSILQAACDLIEPEMLWVKSKNAKRRLEAIVETMDENIENKWLFLLENYLNSLGLKGFSHKCTSSLRTASFYSTGTYAQPCTWCFLFQISRHNHLIGGHVHQFTNVTDRSQHFAFRDMLCSLNTKIQNLRITQRFKKSLCDLIYRWNLNIKLNWYVSMSIYPMAS